MGNKDKTIEIREGGICGIFIYRLTKNILTDNHAPTAKIVIE